MICDTHAKQLSHHVRNQRVTQRFGAFAGARTVSTAFAVRSRAPVPEHARRAPVPEHARRAPVPEHARRARAKSAPAA
eukprot:6204003-Pleurochrysis_carterae.AAC.8